MKKNKLKLNEQIIHLENLGVKFEIYQKDMACQFLKENNYLFKIKSYAKDYDKDAKSNKYINLDFAYLVELSTLDMHLRRIILNIGLNIEHLLKVELNTKLSQNDKEEGYSIVKEFLTRNPKIKQRIHDKASKESFVKNLLLKHKEHISYWVLLEVLDFGSFLSFYKFYFSKYPNKTYKNYYTLAYCVRILRNGAAHNNCILNTMKIPYTKSFERRKELLPEMGRIQSLTKNKKKAVLNNPTLHDILATIVLFNQICHSKYMSKATFNEIVNFLKRCKKNKHYFKKNNLIISKFNTMTKIILELNKKNT